MKNPHVSSAADKVTSGRDSSTVRAPRHRNHWSRRVARYGRSGTIFWIGNDRLYAKVDRQLPAMLETLALDPKKPFCREGRPKSDVHLQLLDAIRESPEVKRLFMPEGLRSFRNEGRPSLQVVIAEPPAGLGHTYAEFDLDLRNPLQDVVGFVVHMGELLNSTVTNHLDLRRTLAKSVAGPFLYYSIVTATSSQSRSRRHA